MITVPELLGLSLEEAATRLKKAGLDYEVETLFPPRDSEETFTGRSVRKYVVRWRELSAYKVLLTIIYR